MGNLEGLSLEFDESMAGWLGIGEEDPVNGRMRGEREHTAFRVDGKITIPDIDRFLNISDHTAIFTGTATFEPLGGPFTIKDGVFNLFSVDPKEGIRHMTYTFRFTGDNGKTYFCHGHKKIKDDPGPLDVIQDMTTLFTILHEGENESGPIFGAGQIFFNLTDTASLMASMRVTGATWWAKRQQPKSPSYHSRSEYCGKSISGLSILFTIQSTKTSCYRVRRLVTILKPQTSSSFQAYMTRIFLGETEKSFGMCFWSCERAITGTNAIA